MSSTSIVVVCFIASLLMVNLTSAQYSDSDETLQRDVRAPKPKFIRFGRAGAKFIRFGRSGANTWESNYAPEDEILSEVKRANKFIRFG